jgi:hypothetical protein
VIGDEDDLDPRRRDVSYGHDQAQGRRPVRPDSLRCDPGDDVEEAALPGHGDAQLVVVEDHGPRSAHDLLDTRLAGQTAGHDEDRRSGRRGRRSVSSGRRRPDAA